MESAQIGTCEVLTGRVPLFCDIALARRIEWVEAQFIAQSSEAARRRAGRAGFVIPIAGGVASFAGEGSPFNKVAGLGFGGVPIRPLSMTSRRPLPPAVLPCRSSWLTWPTPRSAAC